MCYPPVKRLLKLVIRCNHQSTMNSCMCSGFNLENKGIIRKFQKGYTFSIKGPFLLDFVSFCRKIAFFAFFTILRAAEPEKVTYFFSRLVTGQ